MSASTRQNSGEKHAASFSTANQYRTGPSIQGSLHEARIRPQGPKLWLLVISVILGGFLVALDETIIATAIPQITNDFHSLDDIGWYGSSYFLTSCATQLFYGQMYTMFWIKDILFAAIVLFEVGSLVAGVAPNSNALIAGRAISGFGCAGVQAGVVCVVTSTVPLNQRSVVFGLSGAVYGASSVVAPLLGGVFTSKLTWRWCFWINLPCGTIMFAVLLILLPRKFAVADRNQTVTEKLKSLDFLGLAMLMPSIICLLLAFQWAGSTMSWSDARIIVLFILSGMLCIVFFIVQRMWPHKAMLPARIVGRKTVLMCALYNFSLGGAATVLEYYIPIFFQAVRHLSAFDSGIQTLPMILGFVIFGTIAGFGTRWIGFYNPFMIVGAAFMAVGAGLLTLLDSGSPMGTYLGFQILVGAGGGLGCQQAFTAIGTSVSDVDIPTASSVIIFAQIMGSTIFVTTAQNIFASSLAAGLRHKDLLGDKEILLSAGASGWRSKISQEQFPQILEVYNAAVTSTFWLSMALAISATLAASVLEWKSIKEGAVDEGERSHEPGTELESQRTS